MRVKKGLKLSRRDKQLLVIAEDDIKKHHAQALAEERKDEKAEHHLQQTKEKGRAAYLVCNAACPPQIAQMNRASDTEP